MATGDETKPVAQDRIDSAAIAAVRDPGTIGRMIQFDGRVTDTASTMSRPRSGAGNQAIHTAQEHWARLISEFSAEERFDTVNFVLEEETSDQIVRPGGEVVVAAREALAGLSYEHAGGRVRPRRRQVRRTEREERDRQSERRHPS